jgi:hypothetical protein
MVVLIVMIALLGLGMTGLFLTSGSIQMNTNINLRNQALVVAEAGIERARGVLNNTQLDTAHPGHARGLEFIVGRRNSDQRERLPGRYFPRRHPGRPDHARLHRQPHPSDCVLRNVTYLPVSRSADLPSSAGAVPSQAMGKYTVYIRQDQADCRMGNFVCDNSPVPGSTGGTGGAPGGTGGSSGTAARSPPARHPREHQRPTAS